MELIKVKFIDFWRPFNIHDNKFVNALKTKFDVQVLDSDSKEIPDILFYSFLGLGKHLTYNCIKIYYSGENDFPNFNECDYAITFRNIDYCGRHLRYPNYMLYDFDNNFESSGHTDSQLIKRDFCSLLMRNSWNCDPMRIKIIDAVDSYKNITYGGSFRNNIGGPVSEKIPFISRFKFNLALENSNVEGYVTEKLYEPLLINTVPIYWGNKFAKIDFNPESFINVSDYNSLDSFISDLKKIDEDDKRYLSFLKAPKFNKTAKDWDEELATFLINIAQNKIKHVCSFGENNHINQRNRKIYILTQNKFILKTGKTLSKIFKI